MSTILRAAQARSCHPLDAPRLIAQSRDRAADDRRQRDEANRAPASKRRTGPGRSCSPSRSRHRIPSAPRRPDGSPCPRCRGILPSESDGTAARQPRADQHADHGDDAERHHLARVAEEHQVVERPGHRARRTTALPSVPNWCEGTPPPAFADAPATWPRCPETNQTATMTAPTPMPPSRTSPVMAARSRNTKTSSATATAAATASRTAPQRTTGTAEQRRQVLRCRQLESHGLEHVHPQHAEHSTQRDVGDESEDADDNEPLEAAGPGPHQRPRAAPTGEHHAEAEEQPADHVGERRKLGRVETGSRFDQPRHRQSVRARPPPPRSPAPTSAYASSRRSRRCRRRCPSCRSWSDG